MTRPPSGPGSTEELVTDSGLAIERTALAWMRNGLALAVTGAFMIKAAAESFVEEVGIAAGALALLAGAGVWAFARIRYHTGRAALRGTERGAVPGALGRLRWVTLGCCLAALVVVCLASKDA